MYHYHHRHVGNTKREVNRSFRHPLDVVESPGISTNEKFSILKGWEADERALQRAEDEGMDGGEHAHLHRVQEALARLQSSKMMGE